MPNRASSFKLAGVKEYGEHIKAGWQKRKDAARDSVAGKLKTPAKSDKTIAEGKDVYKEVYHDDSSESEDEFLGPRPVTAKAKPSRKSSMPMLDISDAVLNRLAAEPVARRPSNKFFAEQRKRAGLPVPDRSTSPMPERTRSATELRPLDAEDVIYMFAGAPYFDVDQSNGHLEPRVIFGWGPASTQGRDTSDYESLGHKSFACCTVDERNMNESTHSRKRQRRLRERPGMVTAAGRAAGTVGFAHFLEMPLQHSTGHNAEAEKHRQHQRLLLLTNSEQLGILEFDIENILDRLSTLMDVYEQLCSGHGDAAFWDQYMIEDIGEDLFTTLLSPDLGSDAGTESVSLKSQITAIQKALSIEHLWYDFSQESWRARLGQLMWEPQIAASMSSGGVHRTINERDVLMLQTALSAELAVRLELAHRLADSAFREPGIFEPDDLGIVLRAQVEPLEWDVLLFQRFAKCFEVDEIRTNAPGPPPQLSYVETDGKQVHADQTETEVELVLRMRNVQDQIDGLHVFATQLSWTAMQGPQIPSSSRSDSFITQPTQERPVSALSEYGAAGLSSNQGTSQQTATPALLLSRASRALVIHPSFEELIPDDYTTSWQAKSWLSGFLMPGHSTNQALLHTLLESSPSAGTLLSDAMSMSDGFVHNRCMYWSKESTIGRVLAPTSEARECMGWVSLPFIPQGQGDGWIQAYVKEAPYASMPPRINDVEAISTSSDPLRMNDASNLQAGDFIIPLDGQMVPGNRAQFEGVTLTPSSSDYELPAGFSESKFVNLTFTTVGNTIPALTMPLVHAVHFVASYPCYPFTRRQATCGHSPAHDSAVPTSTDDAIPTPSPQDKDLPQPPVHPLHVDFTYAVIPAAALLSSELPQVRGTDSLMLLGSTDLDGRPSMYHIGDQEVVVLDCRGSSDLEVLARAWCSKLGENALIGQSSSTCLACCIREAVALGFGIVIRTS